MGCVKEEMISDRYALYNGDCIEVMATLPDGCVDLSVYSPPFCGLYNYSSNERDLSNCRSYQEFFIHYGYVIAAISRLTKPGRISCVHCMDLPSSKQMHGYIGRRDFSGEIIRAHVEAGWIYHCRITVWKDPVVEMQRTKALGLLYKQIRKDSAMNRVGMPDYMLFFRKDGDNPDRIEHTAPGDNGAIKIARDWLDHMRREGLCAGVPDDAVLAELIRHVEFDVYEWQRLASPFWMNINQGNVLNGYRKAKGEADERHVCPLQLDTIEKCLRLYSKPGDVVMDPFNGIGSTGFVALKMLRRYIGFELKPEYAKQAGENLADAERASGDLFGVAAK
jgi:hypothetical protein